MIYHGNKDGSNTSYGLRDLGDVVEETTKNLRKHSRKFDSIVVMGMSGVLVGAPVALKLKKPLVVLRKASDCSHHGRGVFIGRNDLSKRTLFLDDFISEGSTRYTIEEAVRDKGSVLDTPPQVILTYEYKYHRLSKKDEKLGWQYIWTASQGSLI